jgi:arginyl-tRNA synthetase
LILPKQQKAENLVFYVQYAHARISSIFSKDEAQGIDFSNADLGLLKEQQEFALVRHLMKYPYLLLDISKEFTVHKLTSYAIETADLFHAFYEKHRVLTEDKELVCCSPVFGFCHKNRPCK